MPPRKAAVRAPLSEDDCTCPFSQDWLEDPVFVSCLCNHKQGRYFSKDNLERYLKSSTEVILDEGTGAHITVPVQCPICRQKFSSRTVERALTKVDTERAAAVEAFRAQASAASAIGGTGDGTNDADEQPAAKRARLDMAAEGELLADLRAKDPLFDAELVSSVVGSAGLAPVLLRPRHVVVALELLRRLRTSHAIVP